MRAFTDLAFEERMRFRVAIEAAGGETVTYSGAYVQVNVPRVDWSPDPSPDRATAGSVSVRQSWDGLKLCDRIAELCGLVRDQEPYYFPLGSDQLPARQRHDGPAYCGYGYLGYRFVASYRPAV